MNTSGKEGEAKLIPLLESLCSTFCCYVTPLTPLTMCVWYGVFGILACVFGIWDKTLFCFHELCVSEEAQRQKSEGPRARNQASTSSFQIIATAQKMWIISCFTYFLHFFWTFHSIWMWKVTDDLCDLFLIYPISRLCNRWSSVKDIKDIHLSIIGTQGISLKYPNHIHSGANNANLLIICGNGSYVQAFLWNEYGDGNDFCADNGHSGRKDVMM